MGLSNEVYKEKYKTDSEFRKRQLAKTKRWRSSNKNWHSNYSRKHRLNNIKFLNDLKNVPCVDCGKKYPPWVMDFDHIKGVKEKALSQLIGKGHISQKRILEEVEKCEIVCSNCHRERTHNRSINCYT